MAVVQGELVFGRVGGLHHHQTDRCCDVIEVFSVGLRTGGRFRWLHCLHGTAARSGRKRIKTSKIHEIVCTCVSDGVDWQCRGLLYGIVGERRRELALQDLRE